MTSSPPSDARQSVGSAARCPSCGSRIRPEENWCSLCHHSLRADKPAFLQPGSDELKSDDAQSQDPTSDQSTSPDSASLDSASFDSASTGRVSLKKRGPAFEPTTDPAVIATADRLIVKLAAAEAERARESGLGGLQGKFAGRNSGTMVAVVGGVLLLVIGILGLTLLGLLV